MTDWRHGQAYSWYVALVLAAANVTSIFDRVLMGVAIVPIKADLGLSDAELGLLHGTSFVILYCLAGIPLGHCADLVNRKRLIIIGIVVWGLAMIASGCADSFWSLFAARAAVGLGEACLVPAAMSLLAAYFARDKLARAVAVFISGGTLGKAAAFSIGGGLITYLAAQGGLTIPGLAHLSAWQGTFIIAGIPALFVAALVLTIAEPPRHAPRRHSASFKDAVIHLRLNARAYALHGMAFMSIMSIVHALIAWTVTLFVRVHDLSVAEAGSIAGAIVLILGPTGSLLGGWITDRLSARGVEGAPGITITGALSISIVPAWLFCASERAELAVLGCALLQLAISAATAPALAGVQMLTPERHRGIVTSIFLSGGTLAALGLVPALIGWLTDFVFVSPERVGISLLAALLLFAIAGGLAALAGRRSFDDTLAGYRQPRVSA